MRKEFRHAINLLWVRRFIFALRVFMRPGFLLSLAFILSAASPALSQQHEYIPGKIWMKLKPGNTAIGNYHYIKSPDAPLPEYIRELIKTYHITEIKKAFRTPDASLDLIYCIRFTDTLHADKLLKTLNGRNETEYAEPCLYYRLHSVPNDVNSKQWYMSAVNAQSAWNADTSGHAVIAVVDDAIYINHPDLESNIYINSGEIAGNGIDDDQNGFVDDVNGYNVANDNNNVNPPHSLEYLYTHGTHISGIAAAVTNNGLGIASISNNHLRILPVRAASLPGLITHPEEGIDYAILMKPDVINMSFGSPDTSAYKTLHTLINAAHQKGIILVASAGNDASEEVNYPAGFDHVIAVGATTVSDHIAGFSQYGSFIDVMAPGDSIYSTMAIPSTPYDFQKGTSMACPVVAGLCGLMRAIKPGLSPDQIESCLKSGCESIDSKNPAIYQGKMGAGRINIGNTLQCLANIGLPVSSGRTGIYINPNPTQGIIYISGTVQSSEYALYDINGKLLQKTIATRDRTVMDVSYLPDGIYFLQYTNSQENSVIKLLISH